MPNSFDEYQNASLDKPGVKSDTKVEAPRVTDQDSPDKLSPEYKVEPKDEASKYLTWGVCIGIAALFIAVGARNCTLGPVVSEANPKEQKYFNSVSDEVAALKKKVSEKDAVIKNLSGQLAWVRHLLRVEKENMATAKERIKRLIDEHYNDALKYAIYKFYHTPLGPRENRRELCFTTGNNKKCYKIERPAMQRPVKIGGLK